MHNAGPWVGEALESLRGQTFRSLEAIIVDDGSTDASAEVCRRFCALDPRFRLIIQENEGVSAARNRGVEEARADWIAFMDADDVMPVDALETLVGLQRRTEAGIVAGTYVRTDSPARENNFDPGNALYRRPNAVAAYTVVDSDEAIRLGLYQKRILNTPCGMLFPKSVFSEGVLFRPGRYEDLDFFYRAFEKVGKVCVSDAIVYFYRDTPGSFINSWSPARLDVLDVTDRLLNHMESRGNPALIRAAEDRRFAAHYNMLLEMTRSGFDSDVLRNRCRRVIEKYREAELKDPASRLKNKLGALLSYMGMPAIKAICKLSR